MDRLTRDALVAGFHAAGKPRGAWRVGGEFERMVLRPDGRPVGYHEPEGIAWLLARLAEGHGWTPRREGPNVTELRRDGAAITLEPGGQVELSGAPHASLLELAEEARGTMAELQAATGGHPLAWIALGAQPYAPAERIPLVPKGRYAVMDAYLPPRGPMARVMMRATASFQANFDYGDEVDCAEKVRAAALLSPLHTAIFANSPLLAGRATGFLSNRARAWRRTDPDRTGFPEALVRAYSHERWVDYLLDVPMMFRVVEGRWVDAGGRTFREWMDRGIDGTHPGAADWALHQTTVFPEVRVKTTLELRGADACDLPLALAGIALWTGLLYGALDEAVQFAREVDRLGPPEARLEAAIREGLAGGGRWPARDQARELLAIGRRGLRRHEPAGEPLLDPLEALVEGGRSPAAAALEAWEADPDPAVFLSRVAYAPA